MSNNEGTARPDDFDGDGFASPSDMPAANAATAQHQTVDPNYAGEPTGEHAPTVTGTPVDQWAPPADNYAAFGSTDGRGNDGGDNGGNDPYAYSDEFSAPPKKKRNLSWLRWVAVVVISALVGSLATQFTDDDGGNTATKAIRSDDTVAKPSDASTSEATPSNIRGVLDKVQKAVVTIDVVTAEGEGSGTGMIVSSDGEILTNNHVVTGATSIKVTLDNETEARTAHLLGTDATIDSALIKLDGVSNLPTVEFGDSASVQVGDEVVAIGNALALTGGPSVTSGIISAKDRSIEDSTSSLDNLIQTDTAINPGNSGGPLANMAGQVIGMNTAVIRGDTGEFENIGFALAINTVQPAIADLRNGVTNQPAYLGLNPVTLDDSIKSRYDLTPTEGAVISQVQANSPADAAGLARFDVITEVEGEKITTSDQLVTLIRGKKPNDKVKITYYRGTEKRTTTATLVARPTTTS